MRNDIDMNGLKMKWVLDNDALDYGGHMCLISNMHMLIWTTYKHTFNILKTKPYLINYLIIMRS